MPRWIEYSIEASLIFQNKEQSIHQEVNQLMLVYNICTYFKNCNSVLAIYITSYVIMHSMHLLYHLIFPLINPVSVGPLLDHTRHRELKTRTNNKNSNLQMSGCGTWKTCICIWAQLQRHFTLGKPSPFLFSSSQSVK